MALYQPVSLNDPAPSLKDQVRTLLRGFIHLICAAIYNVEYRKVSFFCLVVPSADMLALRL